MPSNIDSYCIQSEVSLSVCLVWFRRNLCLISFPYLFYTPLTWFTTFLNQSHNHHHDIIFNSTRNISGLTTRRRRRCKHLRSPTSVRFTRKLQGEKSRHIRITRCIHTNMSPESCRTIRGKGRDTYNSIDVQNGNALNCRKAAEFKAKGVDKVYCVASNDAFVLGMKAIVRIV